jgi:phosphatidate cytidylyltransferase
VSAAVLAPLLLAAVWFGFPWIDLVAAIAAPIMIGEWLRLTPRPAARTRRFVLYSIAAVLALLWLRHQPAFGRETILWILACCLGDRYRRLLHRLLCRRRQARAVDQPEQDLVGPCRRRLLPRPWSSSACGLAFDAGRRWTSPWPASASPWSPRPATCWNRRPSAAPA